MIGGVGQRMLASVSKRMAGEFFGNVDEGARRHGGRRCPWAPPRRRRAGRRPGLHRARRSSAVASQEDFLKGIAVGAGLVLLGVVAGACSGGGGDRIPVAGIRLRGCNPTRADDAADERPDRRLDRPRRWRRPCAGARSPRASCWTSTWPGSPSATPSSTRSSSLDEERARDGRAPRPTRTGRTASVGPLHGLPFAFKDTHEVAGWRTTYGSPLFADHVARPRRAGRRADPARPGRCRSARPTCRSSRPGRHTFNTDLRHHPQPGRPDPLAPAARAGERRARWPPAWCRSPTAPTWAARCATRRRSAASSGCGPRCGRVPAWPTDNQWETHVGRRADGPQRRRPGPAALGARRPRPAGAARARRPGHDVRAAGAPARWPGCGWRCRPTSAARSRSTHEVAAVVEAAAAAASPGPARTWPRRTPTSRSAEDTFRTLRAWHFQAGFGDAARRAPRRVQAVAGRQHPRRRVADRRRRRPRLPAAHRARARRMRVFFDVVRRAACCRSARCRRSRPTRSTPPTINGRPMATYLDWMRSAYFITVTGCPAISVPAGTTPDGLPVGVQLVAPHGADRRLLEVAAAVRGPRAGLISTGWTRICDEPARTCGRARRRRWRAENSPAI